MTHGDAEKLKALLLLLAGGLMLGGWCCYRGIATSLHAENGLHTMHLAADTLERYVLEHDGRWPESWEELKSASPPERWESDGGWNGNSWPDCLARMQQYVEIDFSANPDLLAEQSTEDFDALRPIGSYYPSYRNHFHFLIEALEKTRRKSAVPIVAPMPTK